MKKIDHENNVKKISVTVMLLFWINPHDSLGKYSRQQTDDVFIFFILENKLWHLMQTVSYEKHSKCCLLKF